MTLNHRLISSSEIQMPPFSALKMLQRSFAAQIVRHNIEILRERGVCNDQKDKIIRYRRKIALLNVKVHSSQHVNFM